VTLPAGVDWPQLGGAPLFVRPFYEGCYEGVLISLDPSCTAAVRKFTILGNEGIGKSAFGAYVLWRAVQARRTVVYVSNKVHEAFIIHADGRAESFVKSAFDERTCTALALKSTVLICDGLTPPIVDAFTILITSPKRERWKEFSRVAGSRRLFFPVFSRAEMSDMLRSCFPQLHTDVESGGEAGVWARYRQWGGIPRFVLGNFDDDSQWQLESAASRIRVDELCRLLGAREIESDDAASHRLLHLEPAGETADGSFTAPHDAASYRVDRSELGSPYIKNLVYRAIEAQDIRRIESLLSRAPANPAIAKLYGDIFEHAALDALLKGGSFSRFDLSAGADASALVLRPSEAIVFATAADVAASLRARDAAALSSAIFVPRAANYTGVDAVLGDGRALVNFTIDTSHELKPFREGRAREGPSALADALGYVSGAEVNFYWVLPRGRYLERCKKSAPKTKRLALQGGGSVSVRHFAICVPFGDTEHSTPLPVR
jgi:hypothetical protein